MMERLILTPQERNLLQKLLANFSYVDVDDSEGLIEKIVAQIDMWGCTPKNTVFVATREKPTDNDGSYIFLKQLQDHLFGWDEEIFKNIFVL